MPSEPHKHARSEPPIAWLAFRFCRRWLAPLPTAHTATSHRVAAQPATCRRSNPSRVRPFAAIDGTSRTSDRAPLTCTRHAVRRALKLPLPLQLAGAAADGTHRRLHVLGGPADGVLRPKLVVLAWSEQPPAWSIN